MAPRYHIKSRIGTLDVFKKSVKYDQCPQPLYPIPTDPVSTLPSLFESLSGWRVLPFNSEYPQFVLLSSTMRL